MLFNTSTWNFLMLVVLSAVFNVSVLGFSHVFLLTKQYRPLLLLLYARTIYGKTKGNYWSIYVNMSQLRVR